MCEAFCLCSISARLELRPSSKKLQVLQLWSLLCNRKTPHGCLLWNLVQGRQSGKQCNEARLKQDLQCCTSAMAWGYCPDGDAFPEDLSQPSEAALIEEYNCVSKSPWSRLLGCRSCAVALREIPLGKDFFSITDFSET